MEIHLIYFFSCNKSLWLRSVLCPIYLLKYKYLLLCFFFRYNARTIEIRFNSHSLGRVSALWTVWNLTYGLVLSVADLVSGLEKHTGSSLAAGHTDSFFLTDSLSFPWRIPACYLDKVSGLFLPLSLPGEGCHPSDVCYSCLPGL